MQNIIKSTRLFFNTPFTYSINIQVAVIIGIYLLVNLNPLLGIATLAFLMFGYWPLYKEQGATAFNRYEWWFALFIPLAIFAGMAIWIRPIASDDLLRDIIVGHYYNFDYSALYPISSIPVVNMWYGFDHALAWLCQYLPKLWVMWTVQSIAFASMVVVVALIAKRLLKDYPDQAFWVGIVVTSAIALSEFRLFLGRPEIFLSIWAVAALLVRSNREAVLWVLVGLLMTTCYWLAFLYFVAAAMFLTSRRTRLIAFSILMIWHSTFWFGMYGAEYWKAFTWLYHVLNNQVAEVGENLSLVIYLKQPIFVIAAALCLYGLRISNSPRLLPLVAVMIFFIGSNQVRYIGVIGPLMILLALNLWLHRLPRLTNSIKVTASASCVAVMCFSASHIASVDDSPKFQLPEHARVLTAFSHATYAVPFFSPGVQAEPSFAIGAAPKDVQTLSFNIAQGKEVDCEILHKHGFTHVVEKTMVAVPECMALISVHKEWRLWNVK